MTRTHAARPIEAPDIEAALDVLRGQGLRASSARRLVLETLYAADAPLTAEQVAGGLDGRIPRSDQASVYRNLEALEQAGLVHHVHLGHGPGLYVRASGARAEYVMCDECGAVRVADAGAMERVRAAIRSELGHEARFTHFPLAGLCAGCAADAGNAADACDAGNAGNAGDARDAAGAARDAAGDRGRAADAHP